MIVLSRVIQKEVLKEKAFLALLWISLLAWSLLSHVPPTSPPRVWYGTQQKQEAAGLHLVYRFSFTFGRQQHVTTSETTSLTRQRWSYRVPPCIEM